MIYLIKFRLVPQSEEEQFINSYKLTCFDSFYPFLYFPQQKGLLDIEFEEITIFCGSNGSGKSTLLNIIAEKLQLKRDTSYNKTSFF